MEKALRAEAERRFRERTPPRTLGEQDMETRVTLRELREWAEERFGVAPSSGNVFWIDSFNEWYRYMAKCVMMKARR